MAKVVSATEARVHFGALMREVVESGEAVVVERNGDAQIALVPADEYEALRRQRDEAALERVLRNGERIARLRGDQPMLDPVEMVREDREERSQRIDDTLGLR